MLAMSKLDTSLGADMFYASLESILVENRVAVSRYAWWM